jgi:uncharacterized protein
MTWRLTNDVSAVLAAVAVIAAALPAGAQEDADLPAAPAFASCGRASYAPYPAPDAGYVTDLADLLSPDKEERIERWLWQVEARSGVEVAVVTIYSIQDYPGTANLSIESFARQLFDTYGIGNMPENNGVLLLVAVKDRKARIELGAGYGNLRDRDARRIMDDEIVPYFKKSDYAGGITNGVREIIGEFAGCRVGIPWSLIILIAALPVVIAIAFSLFKSGKRGWGWVCVGLVIVLLLVVLKVVSTIIEALPESSSGSWSSGGFGGGFGGGFSGGGGATGSW